MSEEAISKVIVDKEQLESLKKKYPSVSDKEFESFVGKNCKYFSKMDQDRLERFGFKEGKKQEFFERIKEMVNFIQEDYKPRKNSLEEVKGGISFLSEDEEEALRDSKNPIQRLGQGLNNDCFYYGTSLIYRGMPISAIITKQEGKPRIFLGLNYVTFQCKNCGYTEEVTTKDVSRVKPPKQCSCEKSKDTDFEIVNVKNPIKDEFKLNYLTEFNDESIDYQWGTESIKDYLYDYYPKKTIQEIFERIVEINKRYIDHLNPASHSYIACWIIGTYCYTLFEQFGRLYNRAEKGSGKTKQARVLKMLCHNPMWITKGTESSIFRDMEATCGTLIIDNMDKLQEDLKRAIEHYIETGWMKESTYRLTDKETGRTKKFSAYSSMALNNISGLDENTIDKTFEIPMLKSVNDSIKRVKVTSKSENWEEIRNDLRYFILDNWKEISKKYTEVTASFTGREFDVVEGVLAIAKLISSEVYESLEKYVEEKIGESQIELENNPSFMIFSRIWSDFKENPLLFEAKVFVKDLAEDLFRPFYPYLREDNRFYESRRRGFPKYISSIIKSIPMFRKGGLVNGRTYILIKRKDLEQYMILQHFLNEDGSLLSSTTSTTSTSSLTSTNLTNLSKKDPKTNKNVEVGDVGDVGEEKELVEENNQSGKQEQEIIPIIKISKTTPIGVVKEKREDSAKE